MCVAYHGQGLSHPVTVAVCRKRTQTQGERQGRMSPKNKYIYSNKNSRYTREDSHAGKPQQSDKDRQKELTSSAR